MKRTLPRNLSHLCFVAILVLAAIDSRACGTGTTTITNLPALNLGGYQVYALNPKGELTGFFYDATHGPHAFIYETGALADLGTLGGAMSFGYAMNSAGQVAGQADLGTSSQSHAFLYTGGSLTDLGTLGGSQSSAAAINETGQVAGNSLTAGDAGPVAFLYANGSMMGLGTLGSNYSSAFALNNAGMVVGESGLADGAIHGFLYANGVLSDLGTLGSNYSSAFALNDAGLIVGESSISSGDTHAFIYANGVMTDLGTFGGTYSTAFVVNTNSQVAGVATTTNDQETHGFLYDHGTMTDLGTLGGTYSSVWTINNRAQVVGDSATTNGTRHAFLWEKNKMVDLNTLLPANSGWELISAQFINDSDRIVGFGLYGGANQWFVMDLSSGNNPPLAIAGPDQTVDCQAQVSLDGSASTDPDHDPLMFEWSLGDTILGTNATLTVSLPLGTNVLILKVTDPCGACGQTNVLVTVLDSAPPTVSCPNDISAANDAGKCSATLTVGAPTVSDDCGTTAPVGVRSDNLSLTDPYPVGLTIITWTETDIQNNKAACNQTVTVNDTEKPVVHPPANIAVKNDAGQCSASVSFAANPTDNCGVASTVYEVGATSISSPYIFPVGQTIVNVTVTDIHNNTASASFTVTVIDNEPPSIACPPDLVISAGGACTAVTLSATDLGTPVVSDNCGVANVSCNAPANFPIGVTTVNWTVTDVNGNSTTCSQKVSVTTDNSIAANFNGTAISAGETVWFSAVLKPKLPKNFSGPITIRFLGQKIASSQFNLAVPDATVIFDDVPCARTTCDGSGRWTTVAPKSGLAGNFFLSGLAYTLPQSLPGGLQAVTWSGTFITDTPGVTLKWQWAAAVYTQFGSACNEVKSTDDTKGDCTYQNSDHAGTPESSKQYVIGGARGGGGSNWTGSLSGTQAVAPCGP
ncbi:MAG TPA: HYR domain-containing protein [Candidatus Limnocylindrales bacterium]|nr:HYR domain-containing protein [Candidatus Limnocylindrales bacterium]